MEETCVSYVIMIVLQSTLFSWKNKKPLIASVTDINVSKVIYAIHGKWQYFQPTGCVWHEHHPPTQLYVKLSY